MVTNWVRRGGGVGVAIAIQLRGMVYRILFRHTGKQHAVLLGPVTGKEVQANFAQVDFLLLRLSQRLIDLPPGMGIVDFVRFDGKPPATNPATRSLTLGPLRDQFMTARAPGWEASTQLTTASHFRHLVAESGEPCDLTTLGQADLQRSIQGRSVSATTIRKEIHDADGVALGHGLGDAQTRLSDFTRRLPAYGARF